MIPAWDDARPPPLPRPGAAGWLRAGLRAAAILPLLILGLGLLVTLRLLERAVPGRRQRLSPLVACAVCRAVLGIIGLRVRVTGQPMSRHGMVVANHASWLDIPVLNAARPVVFVAKAEVAGWPGIGLLARATGTVFTSRDPRRVRAEAGIFAARLAAGHRLLVFAEGTSTDGQRVLPFRTAPFAALIEESRRQRLHLQPVSVAYHAPPGADPRRYAWWGDMALGPHLLGVLAARRQGQVHVRYHPPRAVRPADHRKRLAAEAEAAVRSGLQQDLALTPARR